MDTPLVYLKRKRHHDSLWHCVLRSALLCGLISVHRCTCERENCMSASKATGTVSRADQTSNWFDESNTGRYQAYSYSYPHKTAYREFAQPLDLKSVWEKEKRDALFLYLHIPFCEMRCGFCNLFTTSNPETSFEGLYLNALERQAQRVRGALGDSKFARMAPGGGTR